MKKLILGLTLAATLAASNARALISIETVPVGNAGNAADPITGKGAVGYDYGIGKYEVTVKQYCAFLNAVGTTDTYGLYDSIPYNLDISRSGSSGNYSYSVVGSGNHPVTYVSSYDAARFVNWLHNGQPVGLQVAGTTETGSYTLTGNTGPIMRNAGATFVLPSGNEWYKAAFHQPVELGGDSDNYWFYPTASNVMPNSRNGSSSDPNSGNFLRDDGIANGFNGGLAVTDSWDYDATRPQDYLTDVGAFSLAASFYGTFDQCGNVWEWNEDTTDGLDRGFSGGSYGFDSFYNEAIGQNKFTYSSGGENGGFRVALVPEPSVFGLLTLGLALVARKRK